MSTDTDFQYTIDRTFSVGTMTYTVSPDIPTTSASSNSPTYTFHPSSSVSRSGVICHEIPGSESFTCIPESASTSFTSETTSTGYNHHPDSTIVYNSESSSPMPFVAVTVVVFVLGTVILAVLLCLYRRRSKAKKSRGILELSEDNNELSVIQAITGSRGTREGHVKGPYVNHTACG